jgi:hypothetical protein
MDPVQWSDAVGCDREMLATPMRIFQRFISRAAGNNRKKTQDAPNVDFANKRGFATVSL